MYDSVCVPTRQQHDRPQPEDRSAAEPFRRNCAGRGRDVPAPTDHVDGLPAWLEGAERLSELHLSYDAATASLWQWMAPAGRPSFTEGLLRELTFALDVVERAFDQAGEGEPPIRYVILGSELPGIFNLGGNLALFQSLIEAGDRERLLHYARVCARGQFRIADHFGGRPVCTVALVQGDALGGGFESALAHDVIIAERSARFGLPEVLFNMFPGMGAYSFLSRRLDCARAERLILSGRVSTAEELFAEGVVDRVVDDGCGFEAVYEFMATANRQWNSRCAVTRVRDIVRPVELQELIRITDLWVDAALSLTPGDLRRMKHLAKAQDRRCLARGHAGTAPEMAAADAARKLATAH